MPEARRRVSDLVHDRLRSDVLSGALAPGDAVPSERVLAEELGVNRHAVREALKRLEQAGLVRITQGGATKVLDWRDSGGLEVLLDLVGDATQLPPPELIRSVLEVRATIGVDAARRCAERGDEAARDEVRGQAELTADAIGAGDGAAIDERYGALWRAVVLGSGNVAYRLALNSLVDALDGFSEIAAAVRPSDPAAVRALGEAVSAADPARATRAAAALLEPDVDAFA